MKLTDLSMRLYDMTHYLFIPQWQVTEEYHNAKQHMIKMFPGHTQYMYQHRALTQVYEKYEEILLDGIK